MTLFIADLSGGGVTTVQSWGLQMDIVAVPEVETWIAAALAGAFGAFWLNRAIWHGSSSTPRGEVVWPAAVARCQQRGLV